MREYSSPFGIPVWLFPPIQADFSGKFLPTYGTTGNCQAGLMARFAGNFRAATVRVTQSNFGDGAVERSSIIPMGQCLTKGEGHKLPIELQI
jgi:hypothetical protein